MHLPGKRHGLAVFGAMVAMLLTASSALAATDIPVAPAAPYSQTFGSDTSATVSLPGDFRVDKLTGARVVGTYAAALTATERQGGESLSTTAANGIYNFGAGPAATATDRAIGWVSSGTATQSGNLYGQFINTTGQPLSGLTLSYDVEKYRNGSNAAGFRIQLFHSTNGSTWTDAGSSFLTTFTANADNSGCLPAPCATQTVSNQALNVAIAPGAPIFLAWNYSVASGTTTSNAQALAIDNISLLGLTSPGGPTNPSVAGAASPSTVLAGAQTLLTATVTPGTNPMSTGIAVIGNLTTIGGLATQAFFDDGTNGDVTASDSVFSFQVTVAPTTTAGSKSLPLTVSDGQGRGANTSIGLTVTAPVAIVPIGQVQGSVGDGVDGTTHRSPFAPPSGNSAGTETVKVKAVIYQKTIARQTNGDLQHGLFIQNTAAEADSDPNSSDGLFVFLGSFTTILRADGTTPAYAPVIGDEVVLSGKITEFNALTELSSPRLESVVRSGVNVETELPAFAANPPFDPGTGGSNLADVNRYWERREGMRSSVPVGSIAQGPQIEFASTADAEVRVINPTHPVAQRSDPYARRVFRDAHPLDNLPADFDDGNPYRILLGSLGVKGATGDSFATVADSAKTFDTLNAPAVGGVYWAFGKYSVQVASTSFASGPDPSENHPPAAPNRATELSVATFNVENLYDFRDDPNDGCDFIGNSGCPGVNPPFDYAPANEAAYQTKLTALATQIIHDLKQPDIIMTQEGEDQDICTVSGNALSCGSADTADGKPDTLQDLALRVQSLGGPAYDVASDRNGADARGIVSGFMYRTDRVQLPPALPGHPVLGSAPTVSYPTTPLGYNTDVSNPKVLNAALPADATAGADGTNVYTRAPQVGLFRIYQTTVGVGTFEEVYAISNHFSSGPDGRVPQRKEQAKYGAAIVAALQAAQPGVRVLYGGDLNVYPRPDDPFPPSEPASRRDQLAALYNLPLPALFDSVVTTIPVAAYSYVFDHMAQTLDQMFVTPNLRSELVEFRTAHVNADWPTGYAGDDTPTRVRGVSDHDPSVARFTLVIVPDTTAPVSTATTTPSAPDGQNGWFTSPVTVALTAVDEANGSGVKEIVYSATGTQPIASTTVPGATATFQIMTEGTTSITFFARDTSNNAEVAKSLEVKLDASAPTTTATTTPTQNGQHVTVALSATDPGTASGVKEIVYSATGAQPISSTTVPGATATFQVTTAGTTTVTYLARDNAGRSEAPKTLVIEPKNGRPKVQLSPDAVDFGGVAVGTTSPDRAVALTNTGDVPLTVSSLSLDGGQASEFSIVSPSAPLTIPAGQTQAIVVRFAPTSKGQKTARLVIQDTAPGERRLILRGVGQ